jgi:peptide/nickel transport system substrate-binding protein
MWARIGVKATLAGREHGHLHPEGAELRLVVLPATAGAWPTYDAQYALQSLVRTRATGADGNFNFSRLSDATVDTLIDAIKTEIEPVKRNALINAALTRIRDEVFFIPIHYQVRPWAMKKNISTLHRSDDKPEARLTTLGP